MSNIVDLTKKVGVILTKKKIDKVIAQVAVVSDVSGSMHGHYTNGTMSKSYERILPVAIKFDDNGEADSWVFDTHFLRLDGVTIDNVDGYVKNEILSRGSKIFGGTAYAPVLNDLYTYYFGGTQHCSQEVQTGGFLGMFKKTEVQQVEQFVEGANDGQTPIYVIFKTDGDNVPTDRNSTDMILKKLLAKNVYIMFVGIGSNASYNSLKNYASQYPNADFTKFDDLSATSEDQLYEHLLSDKFAAWASKFQKV